MSMRKKRVNVVAGPWTDTNTQTFFRPLFANRSLVQENGTHLRFCNPSDPGLTDCDVLIVSDKHFADRWPIEPHAVQDILSDWAERSPALVYLDLGDSSGLLRSEAVALVDAYWKPFLLCDRMQYTQPQYGGRAYTDYYRHVSHVVDPEPLYSTPIRAEEIGKLRVSWNMGIAGQGFLASRLRAIFSRLSVPPIYEPPIRPQQLGGPRPIEVSCRINTNYRRPTVAHQRRATRDMLGARVPIDRLSLREYFRELAASRIVISPFGWGEFAYRDFETFLAGAALLKPTMDHLQTYPDYYRAGETMIAVSWDLADFLDVLEASLSDRLHTEAVARQGQKMYIHHNTSRDGREAFVSRFGQLLSDIPRRAQHDRDDRGGG